MKEYEVVLLKQKAQPRSVHRAEWDDLHTEYHRVEASNDEEAIAKAHDLVSWVNERFQRKESGMQRVLLRFIYDASVDYIRCIWDHVVSKWDHVVSK